MRSIFISASVFLRFSNFSELYGGLVVRRCCSSQASETGVGVLLRIPRPLCGLLLDLRRTPTPASEAECPSRQEAAGSSHRSQSRLAWCSAKRHQGGASGARPLRGTAAEPSTAPTGSRPPSERATKRSTNSSNFQCPPLNLIAFHRLKQRLEISFTKTVIALALNELKEHRAQLGLREDLQQQAR